MTFGQLAGREGHGRDRADRPPGAVGIKKDRLKTVGWADFDDPLQSWISPG
jgi:hypothetical protein